MPTLSHSQIETLAQCQRRWWLTKVARVEQAPSESLILGTAFHAALEADARRKAYGGSGLALTRLVAVFGDALAVDLAERDPHGCLDESTREQMRMRGLAMLCAYVERVQPHFHPSVVERELTVPIPGLPGWDFTGRVDAMTQRADSVDVTLVDWKTASKPWLAGAEHDKPQATAYLWLANAVEAEEGWENNPNRVTFIVFAATRTPDGGYDVDVQFRPTRRDVTQIQHWLGTLPTIAAQMNELRQRTDAEAGIANTSPLCGWCGALGSCAAGRRFLSERGRRPQPEIARFMERRAKAAVAAIHHQGGRGTA